MRLVCPHCKKVNHIAGYYHSEPRVAEGNADRRCICGFCGKKFEPGTSTPGLTQAARSQPSAVVWSM